MAKRMIINIDDDLEFLFNTISNKFKKEIINNALKTYLSNEDILEKYFSKKNIEIYKKMFITDEKFNNQSLNSSSEEQQAQIETTNNVNTFSETQSNSEKNEKEKEELEVNENEKKKPKAKIHF
jgi:recombination DNA repair RAD52 pathway protein